MNNNSIPDEFTPTQFFLSQNYPNPFKEKTVIKYCVPLKTKVHIAIYNDEGKMLKILVNEIKNPGTHQIEINLAKQSVKGESQLADGYYFYQMTTEEFSSEKKWFCINHLFGRLNMKTLIQTLFFFLLATQIGFGQWVQVGLNNQSIKDIEIQDATIFAVTLESGKVFRSIDNGSNWTMIVDSLAYDVAISSTGKVFIVKDTALYYSLDNGDNWIWLNVLEQIQDSIPSFIDVEVYNKITISPLGRIFCNIGLEVIRDLNQDFIALSDDGITWSTPGMGVIGGRLFDFKEQSLITIGHFSIRYGGESNGEYIHLSTDNGNTWYYLGQAQGPYDKMSPVEVVGFFSNNNIITGGIGIDSSGFATIPVMMMSTDMCSTWTKVSSLNCQVGLSVSDGSTEGMLVGTERLGVFFFSDEGDSLGSKNEGLTNLNIHTLTLDNNGFVYAGTANGVWRRPLTEIVTSVDEKPTQPTEFILEQNYPNPFNPSTTIKYSIPNTSIVKLTLFNLLGEEVTTLVNEEMIAGNYSVEFNASALPSGVYFYQLRAGGFVETKKMILLK